MIGLMILLSVCYLFCPFYTVDVRQLSRNLSRLEDLVRERRFRASEFG